MSERELKKFCRITKYLETFSKSSKALYQAIDDLCLFGLFTIRGKGITFLLPDDKIIKQIVNATYSDNPESAIEMIKTLVLLDYLPNAEDFNRGDIANALHKKLEVKSVDGEIVHLQKHTLEKCTKYTPFRSSDKSVVYILKGSELLPTNTDSVRVEKIERNHKFNNNTDEHTGGYMGGGENHTKSSLAKFLEDEHSVNPSRGVYRCFMAFMYKLVLETDNIALIRSTYLGTGAFARASFYVLISPYSDSDYYNIQSDPELFNKLINFKTISDSSWGLCKDHYKEERDKLIKRVREIGEYSIATINSKVANMRTELKSSGQSLVAKTREKYGEDKLALAKDLINVFTFLSIVEKEVSDPSWFKQCYVKIMSGTFSDIMKIVSMNSSDIAHSTTFYNTLISTDLLYYHAYCANEDRCVNYEVRGFPSDPTSNTLISAEKHEIIETKGGSECEIYSFMNG